MTGLREWTRKWFGKPQPVERSRVALATKIEDDQEREKVRRQLMAVDAHVEGILAGRPRK